MKELIPLKKDIMFSTKVSEITAIDVEHDYKIKDDVIEGKLLLNGTYKMTEASLIEEDFFYEIPFSIAIGNSIKKETINIEINDFKYELEGNQIKINSELELTCEKEEEIIMNDNDFKTELDAYFDNNETIIEDNTNIEINPKINVNTTENNIDTNETINNITNNIINNEEKYNTYKVYIVREGDNIDTICAKYNVKYEDVKEYNNLNEINIGDKIIIPYIHND